MSRKVNPLYSWLTRLRQSRNVGVGDARPLYSYRISDVEFDELNELLRQATIINGRSVSLTNYSDELFCLYGSEWLRRFHTDGNPRWRDITDSLDWSGVSYPKIIQMVGQGLKYWRRPTRDKGKNTGFLHTLACEGGLPIRMMENQSGSLTRFFRRILKALRTQIGNTDPFVIASQQDDCLPHSMRNELVYEVAGEFCQTLNQLLDEAGAQGGDKLAKLKSVNPLWYEALPLVMSEEHAEKLFAALYDKNSETTKVRNTVSVVRRWVEGDNCWHCDAHFKLPLTLTQAQLELIFELVDKPEGSRLVINGQWIGSNQPLALLSLTSNDDWMVEAYPVVDKVIDGAAAMGSFSLSLQDGQTALADDITPNGGAALTESLPWVMEALNQNGTELKLLGVGSVNSTQESVYVALPPGSMLQIPSSGKIEIPRFIDDCQRTLIEVSGHYRVALDDGAECVIRTDLDDEQASHYVLRGNQYVNVDSKYPVHKGLPVMVISDGESYQVIPSEELTWRALKPGNKTWYKRTEREPIGQIELRHQVGNEVKYSIRLSVLPLGTSVKLIPKNGNEGFVELHGLGAAEIYHENQNTHAHLTITQQPEVAGEPLSTLFSPSANIRDSAASYSALSLSANQFYQLGCVSTQNYPAPLELMAQWPEGEALSFSIPFPAEGGRFIDASNQVFDNGLGAINRLQGIRAEVLEFKPSSRGPNTRLEATLCAENIQLQDLLKFDIPLQRVSDGALWSSTLIKKHQMLRALLSCSNDLDATIKLQLAGSSPAHSPNITLRRYDCQFETIEGQLVIDEKNVVSLQPEEKNKLVVNAISLLNPSAGIQELPVVGGDYDVSNLDSLQGPWLAWGTIDGISRVRPTLVKGFEGEEPNSLFGKAIATANSAARKGLLTTYFAQLAESPTSQEWFELITYIIALKKVPVAALDFYTVMLQQPRLMLTLLINATMMGELEHVWALQDELPFNWAWFEVNDWIATVESYAASLDTQNQKEEANTAGLQSIAMFVTQMQNKVEQDVRIKLPIDLIARYLNDKGMYMVLEPEVTSDQLDKACQDLARSFGSWGWIIANDANAWQRFFSEPQKTLIGNALLRRKYSKPVELLLNTMITASAMTAFGHAGLVPFSKPFELIYQHAPEQLGTVFHLYQRAFWEHKS